MNIREAHRAIWQAKLEGIQAPNQQYIDRVVWTCELIPKGSGHLLDIGTGSGAMLARGRGLGYEVTGVDFDPPLVEWLKAQLYDVRCVDVNSEPLPLLPNTYDVVTCCDAIEHLVDPAHMLAEAFRVMKPGGGIYVSTPNLSCWRRVLALAAGTHPHTSGDHVAVDGGHVGYYGALDLAKVLTAAGFRDVRMEYRNADRAPDKARLLGGHSWLEYTYQIAIARKP